MKKFIAVSNALIGKTITGGYFEDDRIILSFDSDEYITIESEYERRSFVESELHYDEDLILGVEAGVLTPDELEAIREKRKLENERKRAEYEEEIKERELKELARLKAKYPENL